MNTESDGVVRSMEGVETFEFKPTTNRIATVADTRCHVALFMNRDGSGEIVISHPNREPHRIAVATPKEGWRISLARYPTGEIEALYVEDKKGSDL